MAAVNTLRAVIIWMILGYVKMNPYYNNQEATTSQHAGIAYQYGIKKGFFYNCYYFYSIPFIFQTVIKRTKN